MKRILGRAGLEIPGANNKVSYTPRPGELLPVNPEFKRMQSQLNLRLKDTVAEVANLGVVFQGKERMTNAVAKQQALVIFLREFKGLPLTKCA